MNPSYTDFDVIEKESTKVTRRENQFIIFSLRDPTKLVFGIDYIQPSANPGTLKKTPNDKLIELFTLCKSKIDPLKCAYIFYDFSFYTDDGLYRNATCLVTFIPDSVSTLIEKFSYSSNSITLGAEIKAQKLITLNNLEDFEFENIKHLCMSFRKN
ncbi:actin-depolymerizing factor [Spraguea lophii 42_110]|uniref:Actin-depolymerizing factor n=1 Tax=Spraguea lophii (strain 42_110) TaxID=1358809 RepID=S7WE15_SPRLO|nr:actin-depolymerizing factor [Spraguea lophii 42_110]